MRPPPSPPDAPHASDTPFPPATRRDFVRHAVATATVACLWFEGVPSLLRARRTRPTPAGADPQNLEPLAWRTLEAASEALLPSAEGSPGASEVNAIGYLDAVLADDGLDPDHVARIHEAARLLDAYAREAGATEYAALDAAQRAAGLDGLQEPWAHQLVLRSLLALTLEAFLGDPVHGGNPDGLVWRWAEHRPGYPRPSPGWRPRGVGPQTEGDR